MFNQPQTFFRPDELRREHGRIRADLFNRCRLLLSRSRLAHVFVPIRGMQFLAVITPDEVLFVDSEAYAVRGDEGGRMILLAWQRLAAEPRDSLTAPVSMDVVHYHPDQEQTQRRLMAELPKAVDLLLSRQPMKGRVPVGSMKVVTLMPPDPAPPVSGNTEA
ncbi:hypothetical protein F2Q65_05040 [Thiohalocapsa marina]|uniref:Uncharacterized protein n=1 Tax=Thiohalocapsa marina TaxID=424902 RepID=A0A5M8FSI2_9GAMM|nr:hypothetical protein [Thiohalocapsa marina]KAA6186735.1 hypothetical protein F2Q65_05040 [Thiohalocapsa marina]